MSQGQGGGLALRWLPDEIARVEGGLVVTFPPTLEPSAQRLLATLGVLVRFKEGATAPGLPNQERTDRRKRRPTGTTLWERTLRELAGGPSNVPALAATLDAERTQLAKTLRGLLDDGLVVRVKRGVYRLPPA